MDSKGTATRVIGIYGFSNSGKTTLIEQAIRFLKQAGYTVAAIKQSDKTISLDQEGKDTARFSAAGAEAVALSTPVGTSLFFNRKFELCRMVDVMMLHHAPDMILVEGAREGWIPKIRIGEIEERENTVWTYNGSFDQLMQMIVEKGEPCTHLK